MEHDLREDGIDGYYSIYVTQGDNVLIHDGSKTIYYFSKSEIETGEIHPKVLADYSQFP